MQQLSFPFQTSTKTNLYKEEDFLLLNENSAAVNFLKKFFAQDNFNKSQFISMMLKGANGSGKTHLLHIFAKKSNAEFLDKEKISTINLTSFFAANKFYILEDIHEIKEEELILRIINSACEAEAFLILSSSAPLKFQLKDLTSRLKNIFAVEIKNLSHESLHLFLANGFSRRQIKLSSHVIDFISDHIARTYDAALAAVKMVELRCQESGKNLTMKEVRKIFTQQQHKIL